VAPTKDIAARWYKRMTPSDVRLELPTKVRGGSQHTAAICQKACSTFLEKLPRDRYSLHDSMLRQVSLLIGY
jgi:hypothetical protein